ncbi:MAG: glycosyltransferase family 1 protein [Chloroflexi bacterium]|nr:MAG: glycosyltransferase family 1 protein [Chloroflexota bacterium]
MILLLTQCFPPVTGGIEALMEGLAAALVISGREVIVLADSKGDAEEAGHDASFPCPVLRFGGPRPWRRWRKRRAVERLLRREAVEAVFADSWKSLATLPTALNADAIPVIALAHGNDVLARGDDTRARRILDALSHASRIAANSRYTAQLVRDLGVPQERIHVVPPGFTPLPAPSSAARRTVADLAEGFHPCLLTLSRLEARKGHDRVIRCLPDLLRRFPRLGYLVAGDGPDRARLERLATEQGVARQVRFLGRVSEDLKSALFERADLFVMPAYEDRKQHSVEGFGLVYLEAASLELPAVAGRSGGIEEAVVDGVTGLLCNGEDRQAVCAAITRMLENPDERQALGKAAQCRAQEFAWPHAIHRYLQLLEKDA